jgi:hypothetical protein
MIQPQPTVFVIDDDAVVRGVMRRSSGRRLRF